LADIPQNNFTSGELSPALHSRPDLSRYVSGLKECTNFFVHPEGGVSNRPGFEFVTQVKSSFSPVKLIPFSFNDLDTYCLEFGDQYMRVIRNGGRVLLQTTPPAWAIDTGYTKGDHVNQSGVNYYCKRSHISLSIDQPGIGASWQIYWYALEQDIVEIPTPYADIDVMSLQYVQSADVITIVHSNYPPMELKRYAHDRWVLDQINFGPSISSPTGVTATGGAGIISYNYVVTAISSDTGEESLPSASVNGLEDGLVISWSAVAGAESYNIYKEKNGVYGYIGNAIGTSFTDEKIIPSLDDTPPVSKLPFSSPGDYPSVVTYHQQRLVFANTNNNPQKIWFSQVANFHNFNTSRPQKAGDAITISVDAAQVNAVRGLVSINTLLVLTSGAEHSITSGDRAFTIDNIQVKPQSYRGSSPLRPIVIGNIVLHTQAFGTAVRTLGYRLDVDGYAGSDISITAKHIFTGYDWVDSGRAEEPYNIVWYVRNDGILVGLTFIQEQEVIAWHKHTTNGSFKSVAVVPENGEDAVYVVVERNIGPGEGPVKYIERLHSREFSRIEDAFFVDSGLTYSGAPVTTLTGLDHLEGETVSILADGNVHPQKVVSGGSITLDYAASTVHVGLPYQANIVTLEPPVQEVQGRWKRASEVIVGVLNTRGLKVGSENGELSEVKQRSSEPWGSPTAMKTGYFRLFIEPDTEYGSLQVVQDEPLPTTVLSIIPSYEVED